MKIFLLYNPSEKIVQKLLNMQCKIHLSSSASDIYLGWQSFGQQLEKEMIKNIMFVAIL